MTGCDQQAEPIELLHISITVAGETTSIDIPPGITVEKAIELSGVVVNPLDRTSPPSYTIISDALEIEVFRVTESFRTEDIIIPFETQTVKNETLPEGQTLLVQAGVNGLQQNTFRILSENGSEVSSVLIKQDLIVETVPEIVMVGVQTPYTELEFSGKIAYLTSGNAWIMASSSGNRRPVLTSGDLDGRIFSLSPDGNWLLFTRLPAEPDPEILNELWILNITSEDSEPIYLRVNNIIHFASWHPDQPLTLAYSTVEPRETSPGWQANNDLVIMSVNQNGIILQREEIVETNSGGIYGWWGTDFIWSNSGNFLVYARPDSIGIVDVESNEVQTLVEILPLQTRGNWAWLPGIALSPLDDVLFYTNHGSGLGNGQDTETSPDFSLAAYLFENRLALTHLADTTGMFAYPSVSVGEQTDYTIAFLQAIFPEQSETSGYHLYITDQDTSNRRKIFPPEGAPGIDPQRVIWSGNPAETDASQIALLYQGNLWLIDISNGISHQLTGDGSISNIDWK